MDKEFLKFRIVEIGKKMSHSVFLGELELCFQFQLPWILEILRTSYVHAKLKYILLMGEFILSQTAPSQTTKYVTHFYLNLIILSYSSPSSIPVFNIINIIIGRAFFFIFNEFGYYIYFSTFQLIVFLFSSTHCWISISLSSFKYSFMCSFFLHIYFLHYVSIFSLFSSHIF